MPDVFDDAVNQAESGAVAPVAPDPAESARLVAEAEAELAAERAAADNPQKAAQLAAMERKLSPVPAPEALPTGVLDLDDRNVLKVRLGGRFWEAVEPTIRVNRELTETLPDDDDASGDVMSKVSALKSLDSLYPQIAQVLRDPESLRPPSRDFVEQHLTGRMFGKLMQALNEDAAEGNGRAG